MKAPIAFSPRSKAVAKSCVALLRSIDDSNISSVFVRQALDACSHASRNASCFALFDNPSLCQDQHELNQAEQDFFPAAPSPLHISTLYFFVSNIPPEVYFGNHANTLRHSTYPTYLAVLGQQPNPSDIAATRSCASIRNSSDVFTLFNPVVLKLSPYRIKTSSRSHQQVRRLVFKLHDAPTDWLCLRLRRLRAQLVEHAEDSAYPCPARPTAHPSIRIRQ